MTDLTPAGAEARLLDCIARSVECDPTRCPVGRCFCRRQVAAVLDAFRLRQKCPQAEPVKTWTRERDRELKRLHAQRGDAGRPALTLKQMADALGVSRWQVKHRIRRLDLPRRRDWSPGRPRGSGAGQAARRCSPGGGPE